jgi:hypothetical protein
MDADTAEQLRNLTAQGLTGADLLTRDDVQASTSS